jgi:hypothetical protein
MFRGPFHKPEMLVVGIAALVPTAWQEERNPKRRGSQKIDVSFAAS